MLKNSVILTHINYTAMEKGTNVQEEKMVHYTILLIRNNEINMAYTEFQQLTQNERFIKRIASHVYGTKAENMDKVISFIDLVSDLKKKFLFLWAAYDEVILNNDKQATKNLLSKISALSRLEEIKKFSDYDQHHCQVIINHLTHLKGETEPQEKEPDMTIREAVELFRSIVNELFQLISQCNSQNICNDIKMKLDALVMTLNSRTMPQTAPSPTVPSPGTKSTFPGLTVSQLDPRKDKSRM